MHGHVLRSSYNLSVLYSTRTVIHFYTWCLNVHLFEFLPVTSFGRVGRNVGLFSAWRVKTLFNHFIRGCPSGLTVVEHSVNIWWPKFDAGRRPIFRYSSLLRYKKMSFQSRSETVGTPSRVPERVWKRVPFHWTRSRESPMTKRAATVSWKHQLVTVGPI